VAGLIINLQYDSVERPLNNMVRIRGGTFQMGSPASERGRYDDEEQRRVTLNDYYIGATEVTVGQFREFINNTGYRTTAERTGRSIFINYGSMEYEERNGLSWRNPGFTQDDNHPVVHVSFFDAVEYCNWLSRREGLTPVYTISGNSITVNPSANGYRLPTEAEWEYACRAGTTTPFNTGNSIAANQANFADAMLYKTTPVRRYAPNQWGLYNMHGNVLEWCSDNIQGDFYSVRSSTWSSGQLYVRSALRSFIRRDVSLINLGFRVAKNGS
jgi:formylglycine-generating enzyme required for sulfatase activity